MIHELKTWPEFFDAVDRGEKTFEVRRDDRGFQVGDEIVLQRWQPNPNEIIGGGYYVDRLGRREMFGHVEVAKIRVRVTYKLPGGQFGVEPGHCVLGFHTTTEGRP